MLLRQLEYLVALARERHFARAAAACYVSQPSLSAGIRKLEHELDVPIVYRGSRFEGLTPEGERVLAWAHRILAERDALRQELSEMRGGLSGTLRMGAIPTALTAASLLTTPFCEKHPQARVGLESLSSQDITKRLAWCRWTARPTVRASDWSSPTTTPDPSWPRPCCRSPGKPGSAKHWDGSAQFRADATFCP